MRFRSIRWHLATTYLLFTIVVVSLVGLVTIWLVRQQIRQQEEAYLRANATILAGQAAPLLNFGLAGADLQALAETAAFLGNNRVKIFDGGQAVLADSGLAAAQNGLVWLGPSMGSFAMTAAPTTAWPPFANRPASRWMIMPGLAEVEPPALLSGAAGIEGFDHVGVPDAQLVGVIKRDGWGWGGGFSLELVPAEGGAAPGSMIQLMNARQALVGAAASIARPEGSRSDARVRVPIGGESTPLGYVELSEGPNMGAAAMTTTYRAFGIAAACAALVAIIISLLVSRRITAPLAGLTAAARQMSSGDLSSRAPLSGQDEVGQLALQFNTMAARLQASFAELAAERDTLRRFVADASHELRTPITALKTFNELMQSYASGDPRARDEFLTESQSQLERLEAIVHHLLDLSRLDAQLVPLQLTDEESGDLLETVARRLRPLALERDQRISVARPEPAPILRCDRVWLEMALANLLDNALKFSPPGARVELGVNGGDAAIELWVSDQGAGIDPADQPHVFERFYRGRGVSAAGSGLGLAIVQSVVQAHGGAISLRSAPGAGSRFAISLPSPAAAG